MFIMRLDLKTYLIFEFSRDDERKVHHHHHFHHHRITSLLQTTPPINNNSYSFLLENVESAAIYGRAHISRHAVVFALYKLTKNFKTEATDRRVLLHFIPTSETHIGRA